MPQPVPSVNVECFLIGQQLGTANLTGAQPSGFMDQLPNNLPSLVRPPSIIAPNKGAIADLDYKRPKIDVLIQNDIFNQCANPHENEELMREASTEEDNNKEQTEERKAFDIDFEECRVMKPTKEDIYNDEDYEFMSLVPDPIEPKLFEYTMKVQRERMRR